jgi:hypothetical protein
MEDLIIVRDLVDTKTLKGKFTWTNRRFGPSDIIARLDRFLVHNDLLLLNYVITSKIISSSVSNHKPISLYFSPSRYLGHIPFRFYLLWLHNVAPKVLGLSRVCAQMKLCTPIPIFFTPKLMQND